VILSSGILRSSWWTKMVKLLRDTHQQHHLFKLRYVFPQCIFWQSILEFGSSLILSTGWNQLFQLLHIIGNGNEAVCPTSNISGHLIVMKIKLFYTYNSYGQGIHLKYIKWNFFKVDPIWKSTWVHFRNLFYTSFFY
jgi:hypothetical protein